MGWTNVDNNKAFLEQRVVMVTNPTLSIPNMLREERPDDYYRNAATIEWPRNTFGGPLVITGGATAPSCSKRAATAPRPKSSCASWWRTAGSHTGSTSRGDRLLPPMRKLVEQPFWLDPSDPHRMRSAMQTLTQPHSYGWWGVRRDHERRFDLAEPRFWRTAVHRVAAEGCSPEQAVDEAIARIKQILSE